MTEVCILTTKNSPDSFWYITSSLSFLLAGLPHDAQTACPSVCRQEEAWQITFFGFCLILLGNRSQNHTTMRKKNLLLSYLFHQGGISHFLFRFLLHMEVLVNQQKPLISPYLGIEPWKKRSTPCWGGIKKQKSKGIQMLVSFCSLGEGPKLWGNHSGHSLLWSYRPSLGIKDQTRSWEATST